MGSRHLRKGDTNPPLVEGKLRLYSMIFCPFAQRVRLVLDTKKIPYDTVNIHLGDKPDFLFERNPVGKVPAIEMANGDCIYESLIVSDYLDEKYSQRPLHSKDPMQKAKDRLLLENFNKIPAIIYRFYEKTAKEIMDDVMKELDTYEKELSSRKTTFFGGDKPGMLDLMIWPWFERLDAQKYLGGDSFGLPKNRFPKLITWMKEMKEDEGVKISYLSPELHAKFINERRSGGTDYFSILDK